MITIYVFLFARGLKDYNMNIQDLSNLYKKKIWYNYHIANYKYTIIDVKSTYGLQIHKKTGIQAISLDFLEKWNSVVRNTEKQLIELLLTEAKIVYKSAENKKFQSSKN